MIDSPNGDGDGDRYESRTPTPRVAEPVLPRVSNGATNDVAVAGSEAVIGHPADRLLAPGARDERPLPGAPGRGRELVRRLQDAAIARGLALSDIRYALAVYAATRVVLIVVAVVDATLRHTPFTMALANWDGDWYRSVANIGYPTHVDHLNQTNLGFFPLYPMVMRVFAYPLLWTTQYGLVGAITMAGVLVSTIGGLVTLLLLQRMATEWWDEQTGRKAVLLFCLFPGSIVFTMVYAEGIAIPLAAGCIYALTKRRWVLAGVLAGLATAAEPEALILVPVCAVSALLELRRRGWLTREGLRSLCAPVLAPVGAILFGAFLWAWTGSPFASFSAQHDAWHERTSPLALIHDAKLLIGEIRFSHLSSSHINLNYVVGLVGAVLLAGMLILLFKQRRRVPVPAIVWTLGISLLAVTSWNVPPNPRLLITAFPLLMVVAYYGRGRWWTALLWANGILLVGLSTLTYVGLTLRP